MNISNFEKLVIQTSMLLRVLSFIFIALFFLGCSGNNDAGNGKPEVQIKSVKSLGIINDFPSIKGRDGGYSANVFGYSIWVYGDTILQHVGEDGSTWRNNSWAWTIDTLASDGITDFSAVLDSTGAPFEFFPQTDVEREYNDAHAIHNPDCIEPCGARKMIWPGAIINDLDNERALIFYSKYEGLPGEFNFWKVGSSIAVWDSLNEPVRRPDFNVSDSEPTLLFPEGDIQYGEAALIEGEYLYAFGCEDNIDKHCYIARVKTADALDRSQWKFWNNNQWQNTPDNVSSIFNGHNILSVHYNEYLGKYISVYSQPLENKIYLRTSESPQGQWSTPVLVANTLSGADGTVSYSALAHPEFALNDGQVEYITYYRNTGELEGEIILLEVEIGKL